MTTIYDIAKIAGVSPASVSRALNGLNGVSKETRDRILQISKALDYYPDTIARGLSLKRSWLIGVSSVSEFNSPFFYNLLTHFSNEVSKETYDLLFFQSKDRKNRIQEIITKAERRKIDGLLLTNIGKGEPIHLLNECSIPIVVINADITGKNICCISTDHYGGAFQAMKYLIKLGHKKIGYIGEDLERIGTKSGIDRFRGYLESLKIFDLPHRKEWVQAGDYDLQTGYLSAKEIIKSSDWPSAIFCAFDTIAIGAMRAFQEEGLIIGKDISIIGFDDINIASEISPPLTTIRQDFARLGSIAGQQLIKLIVGDELTGNLIVPSQLIERESTCTYLN
ncbi:LacI family DNA-binding transcriptional regulator [Pullulanibacillus sp. KACC 23026]|uniref:LacI family DNA-binding transcriptional regulator n=1 Tax=Pullulanibacillus sp. KACC 23026 TaxID=3028315 RepID=UPI0023B0A267|nr:LacI family DNA-binding transcriptional regulator [Pullulanibacillus sp. KACC 23026]WEG11206.1 LacI family DNA-binding transcriptional regulator [Pullulanibacillus sp. KACC 23026]